MHASSSFPSRKAPPLSFPMHSGIFFIGVLSLICWGIQLLPVISVPITGKSTNYNLSLSHYNNISFGVFGVCDTVRGTCSSPKIGYTDNNSIIYPTDFQEPDSLTSITEVQLPSNVTHLISKLLVLHVVAFGFTCLLVLQSISLLLADVLDSKNHTFGGLIKKLQCRLSASNASTSHSEETLIASRKNGIKRHSYQQLTFMFLFATLSFLLSLLAFLADFVLFVPKLGPLGWIQMLPVLIMATIAALSCFLKRSIQSRRHLDDSVYLADDMRAKHSVFVEWDDDLHSDYGVFIYSNGFSNENKDEERRMSSLIISETEMHSLSSEHHLDDEHAAVNHLRISPV